MWFLPTFGLFVTSFRPAKDILETGWWNILPHKDWETTEQIQLPKDTNLREPITVGDQTFTTKELTQGITVDGKRYIWENNMARLINVQEKRWTTNINFTLDNYKAVFGGKEYNIKQPDGTTIKVKGSNMTRSFLNTLASAVPSTIFPVLIATLAAYGFAWMKFPGKKLMFLIIILLLVVPVQVVMSPVLKGFTFLGLNGTFLGIWIAHTAFGLPLPTYYMYNYISQLPREIFESASIDGAKKSTIFMRMVLPMSVPALASIAIYQFLWVWNDYLVSLCFLGGRDEVKVLSMDIANLVGTRGNDWYLLSSAAFISMIVPLTVFFSLQKYFVRGLVGGAVKG
ncbi:carbohydrate ABC transporter permease [Youxingia wuxianensis]|nr:carbohydrate ABC transporter permease [Youxingia wuxianensis]